MDNLAWPTLNVDPDPTLTFAQTELQDLVDWFAASSQRKASPLGDTIVMGAYANVLPVELDEVPDPDFGPNALPLFVPSSQCLNVKLPILDRDASSQDRLIARLGHLMFISQDDTTNRAGHVGRFVFALIPMDEFETLGAALARHAPTLNNLDSMLVLGVPLWLFSQNERYKLASELPMLPR